MLRRTLDSSVTLFMDRSTSARQDARRECMKASRIPQANQESCVLRQLQLHEESSGTLRSHRLSTQIGKIYLLNRTA